MSSLLLKVDLCFGAFGQKATGSDAFEHRAFDKAGSLHGFRLALQNKKKMQLKKCGFGVLILFYRHTKQFSSAKRIFRDDKIETDALGWNLG